MLDCTIKLKNIFRIAFVAFIIVCPKLNAQVNLTGNAPSYAGREIVFNAYSDPFTETEFEIGKCKVSDNGDFSVALKISEITYIFSHLGIFKGYMYVEPGKSYIISFPDKSEKTPAEKLNPFYKETEFQFAIKNLNEKDINFLILSFNDSYIPYYNKFANNLYFKNKKALLDTTIVALKKLNLAEKIPFYDSYVEYKIGYLKHLAYQQKSRSVTLEYFLNREILYSNPAYLELFNQVFNKYFYFFGQTSWGKKIFQDINKDKSYYKLNLTLQTDSFLKENSLRELVILKNIHDEFYSDKFSRSGLLNILDSLAYTTKISKHKEIAECIRKKITRLMPGYAPPPFELYDKDGKLVKLSDFIGSYVYLNFCTCSSYGCIKEFDLLKHISEKYKDKLKVVTISIDDSRKDMSDYQTKAQLNWTFLHFGNQPDIIQQYDIRAYPTYFLIDAQGKIVFSPAASPGENFEIYFFQTLRQRGEI
jgi:peroxiredoxin